MNFLRMLRGPPGRARGTRLIWFCPGAALSGEYRFGEPCPIAGAEWQNLIVEVVMWVVQHRAIIRDAVADPDVGAGLLFEKKGEILGAHARQQVALDVVGADQSSGNTGRDLGFRRAVDGRRIAALVTQFHRRAERGARTICHAAYRP